MLKEIFKNTVKEIIKDTVKEIIKDVEKKISKWIKHCFFNIFRNNKTDQTNQTSEKSDKLAPSETLNDTINGNTSTEKINVIPNILYKGDTCLIIGAPSSGKSMLTMQIGLDIAGGQYSKIVPNHDTHKIKPQKVYYYDGEMRNTDIINRFGRNHDKYPNTFLRIKGGELDSLGKLFNDVHQRIGQKQQYEDCTIILDNIACFNRKKSTKDVNSFFLSINKLKADYEKNGYNLTVIIVIHTAKEYKKYKPLELNDISGAAEFIRFANSAIALTDSKFGNNIRILKTLKCKFGCIPDKVSICKITPDPYLHFEYERSMPEEDALPIKVTVRPRTKDKFTQPKDTTVLKDKENKPIEESIETYSTKQDKRRKVTKEVIEQIEKLYKEGKTQLQIANLLHLCRKTVNEYLKPIRQKVNISESLHTN
jgi:RecA-family ATPase